MAGIKQTEASQREPLADRLDKLEEQEKEQSESKSNESPLSADVLARLEGMTREELIALIKGVAGAIWGYALMDDIQKAEAARLKLYNLGMSASEVHKVVPALDKWFDRTEGKAPQSIALDVKDDRLDKMPIDRLLRLAAMLDEPAVVLPPLK
jgi:hypothetical protein